MTVLQELFHYNSFVFKVASEQEVNYFFFSQRKQLQGALKVVHRMGFLGSFFVSLFVLLTKRKQKFFAR